MSRHKRKLGIFTSLLLTVGTLVGLTGSSANANTGPTSVTLVSPKPGTVINPDLPFVISLAITGGSAATAKKCFDWDNRDVFGDLSFGAQIIDVNNFGKTLAWGGNGTIFKTDGELYDWSPKIIPNGIQCSLGVIDTTGSSYWPAFFDFYRDSLSDRTDSTNQEWFGTKSSLGIEFGEDLARYAFFDIAWKLNGKVTKVRFPATNLGTPEVSLVGLERGQTIDYEANFQVKATIAKSLENGDFSISFNDGQDASRCEELSTAQRIDNKDGTLTFIRDCVISLVDSETSAESFEVVPYISTSLGSYYDDSKGVIVNVGKQGVPPCVRQTEANSSTLGTLLKNLQKAGRQFRTATTASAARTILADVQKISQGASQLAKTSDEMKPEIALCLEQKLSLAENLVSLSIDINRVSKSIQDFINSPAAQAKAKAQAEANRQKVVAQQRAYEKGMYDFGFKFIRSLTASDLNSLSLWKFLEPGRSTLSRPLAEDWCRQLPTVVPGLPNRVGLPAHPNYVKGCADAAMKIRF